MDVCVCVQAFAPMNPYALNRTQRLASLYGLKSSQQGSGKRRFVLVKPHTSPYNACAYT